MSRGGWAGQKGYGLRIHAFIGTFERQALTVFFRLPNHFSQEKFVPDFVPVRRTGVGYPLLVHFLVLHAFFRVRPADVAYV